MPELRNANYICDNSVSRCNISELVYTVYVDNFVCIGGQRSLVTKVTQAVDAKMQGLGLPTHQQGWGEREAEVLGWQFDGKNCRITPTAKRVWRCRLAVRELCSTKTVHPKDVEK